MDVSACLPGRYTKGFLAERASRGSFKRLLGGHIGQRASSLDAPLIGRRYRPLNDLRGASPCLDTEWCHAVQSSSLRIATSTRSRTGCYIASTSGAYTLRWST